MNLNAIKKAFERVYILEEMQNAKADIKTKKLNWIEKLNNQKDNIDKEFEEELISFGLTPSMQSKII